MYDLLRLERTSAGTPMLWLTGCWHSLHCVADGKRVQPECQRLMVDLLFCCTLWQDVVARQLVAICGSGWYALW
jgi:hypothetical protein